MKKGYIPLLFLAVTSLYGISVTSVDVLGGLVWIGNGAGPAEADAGISPVTGVIGVTIPLEVSGIFHVEPSVYYYGLEYGYDEGPRPRPVPVEHREMYVMNWIAELGFHMPFVLSPAVTLSPGLTASAVFKLPLIVAPGEDNVSSEMNGYFYGNGRFFLPGACVRLDWQYSPRFSFLAKAGARLPVFHIWDGESLPFYDQMHVYLLVGVSYALGD
ncbi:MAG: hypothetical protein JXB03_03680 [Spirochaetales bacterium]|nr:hypothetical protein [Spirochaetales bacterium]